MNVPEMMKGELTYEEAMQLSESKWWEAVPLEAAAELQLYQDRLCMPFDQFHQGVEALLQRPVWTHEFARNELLIAEAEGIRTAPSSPFESLVAIFGEEEAKKKCVDVFLDWVVNREGSTE